MCVNKISQGPWNLIWNSTCLERGKQRFKQELQFPGRIPPIRKKVPDFKSRILSIIITSAWHDQLAQLSVHVKRGKTWWDDNWYYMDSTQIHLDTNWNAWNTERGLFLEDPQRNLLTEGLNWSYPLQTCVYFKAFQILKTVKSKEPSYI